MAISKNPLSVEFKPKNLDVLKKIQNSEIERQQRARKSPLLENSKLENLLKGPGNFKDLQYKANVDGVVVDFYSKEK